MYKSNNIEIKKFLSHYIEGYLFGDLKKMAQIKADKNGYGGVGFPMIMTTLSGMEILGNIVLDSEDTFDKGQGENYFLNYWNNYLSRSDLKYKGFGSLFYHLMRHGLAHTFLTKQGILVYKKSLPTPHINNDTKTLQVDCLTLYKDFRDSYDLFIKPIFKTEPQKILMAEKRLHSLLSKYEEDSKKYFEDENSFPTLSYYAQTSKENSQTKGASLLHNVEGFDSNASG
jgi:hypothetical protein